LEWTETFFTPTPPVVSLTGHDYVLRGSCWLAAPYGATERQWNDAAEEDYVTGFRIATVGGVPEPESLAIVLAAGIFVGMVVALRRRSGANPARKTHLSRIGVRLTHFLQQEFFGEAFVLFQP